jgi:hypothetical protein
MVTDGTGPGYREDALKTATAVVRDLSDPAGIFENLEAGNDTAEPLVEAMYLLATDPVNPQAFAETWILNNAEIVAANVMSDGTYSRLLGGPATSRERSASDLLSTAGPYALVMAAAVISPNSGAYASPWQNETCTDVVGTPQGAFLNANSPVSDWPITFAFTGHAIALIGTNGENSGDNPNDSVEGWSRVFVDGVQTISDTGIWQSFGVTDSAVPSPFKNDVLFAWQWPSSSPAASHTIQIQPGIYNAKEGGAFAHFTSYCIIP